jgi:CHRD domain-containing protein
MIRSLISAALCACLLGVGSRCSAAVFVYSTVLTGPNESPSNNSPGFGFATLTFDDVAHTMRVQVTFSGLVGTTTASHIHSATAVPFTGTAPVATQTPTFINFPLGVTSGTYDNTFNTLASSFYNTGNPNFINAHGGTTALAEAFLISSISSGTAYLNVHTNAFPSGEIRGFFNPEPSSLLLFGACGAAIAVATRFRPQRARLGSQNG